MGKSETPTDNLSFILNKPHDVIFAQQPKPTLQSPHHVIVAINYTGICGSDVHYWDHGAIGSYIMEEPMVLGHESAGTIVSIGSAVKTLQPGDRVALEPGTPCRRCEPCLAGHYNLCPEMQFAATPPIGGTLTGFYAAPEDFCYKLPSHVTQQEGALIEPLAVAVHMVRQAMVQPGHSVVVMGAGPVGLLCCSVAKVFGASKIISVDIQRSRVDFALKLAATHCFIPAQVSVKENATRLLRESRLGAGADVVIDASGAESSIQTSLHVVRRGGVYVQGGMGKNDITFPIMELCLKEVTAKGSFRYGSGDYKLAVELVSSGQVNVKSLITKVVSFGEAEQAFKDVKQGKGIKCLIAGPNEKI
ncbi:xylitol dehydrogenase [Blumeria hordei DH14]|uniref:D-xylulose reductase n=1 Tax=Blumeria graminis f. sp. hordei (strain DH14) TaxID=546991 RepID=N1JEX1_BLUG1|nr:xylitol dehydrogenase [Blumeria hordei DH14]